jgi:RHS repeat-associated protein
MYISNALQNHFIYQGNNPLIEYSLADGKYKYFVYAGNKRIAEEKDGVVSYYHCDQLGSTRIVTDVSGSLVASYKFKPYGETNSYSGTFSTDYQFTGKPINVDSGLSYFGGRFYDSEAGRFLTLDPSKDGNNWYEYCFNNPLSFTDPTGLSGVLTIYAYRANIPIEHAESLTRGGHSWIEYKKDGAEKSITFSTFPNKGVTTNNEIDIRLCNESKDNPNIESRSTWINDFQEDLMMSEIQDYENTGTSVWSEWNPCSGFSTDVWNVSTGDYLEDRHLGGYGYSDPNVVGDSIKKANNDYTDMSHNSMAGEF